MCCAGVDVHKKSIAVNLLRRGAAGKDDLDEVRTFGTMTRNLLDFSEWLAEAGCTHVAIESSGGLLETDLQYSCRCRV